MTTNEIINFKNITFIISEKSQLSELFLTLIKKKEKIQILTINLDHLFIISKNNTYKNIAFNNRYNFIDGIGVSILLFFKYSRLFSRVTGNEILNEILHLCNKNKFKLAIIGSNNEAKNKFEALILKKFPEIPKPLIISPSMNFTKTHLDEEKIIKQINDYSPNFLLAAFGAPFQEIWINNNLKNINAQIFCGIGSAFEFFSGHKKRAPKFLIGLGLEWLWRVFQEPLRLSRRYFINDLPFLIKEIFKLILNK